VRQCFQYVILNIENYLLVKYSHSTHGK
jgi:hypothetical protein